MGMRSLSGLGTKTRWAALAVRVLVITLLAGAMAEPQLRRTAEDVAVTVVVDASESVPASMQSAVDRFVEEAIEQNKRREDRIGLVTAARGAFVQALPTQLNRSLERNHTGELDGTDLAAAARLALAVMPKDAANRLLLASDGNDTVGGLLEAAQAAKALGVPIDVIPLRYRYDSEVILDQLVAPPTARQGETLNVRVVLQATRPSSGRLSLLLNGEPIDLDPADDSSLAKAIELPAGQRTILIPVTAVVSGAQRFEAIFEPDIAGGRAIGDTVAENNKGMAVTFVSGEGKVLVLADSPEEAEPIMTALQRARINAQYMHGERMPQSLEDLNTYDAIVMLNQPAFSYSEIQQEYLRQYVHDTGGGLVMIGGPNAFGAGGWIGSPLEDALPIRLDPPQKRQMPRGALALVMHSIEMPEGVYYGKKTAEAAVNALSRLDLAGVIEYSWNGKTEWVHPLGPVGDGTAIKRSINSLQFGDMPDFAPSFQLALAGLKKAEAGQRHMIIISDGDPSMPPASLLDEFRQARITVSTVGVFPHSGGDLSRMEHIADYTGGRHYEVTTQAGLATLPKIFVKEAQTVRRSLIWEGPPFSPSVLGVASEAMRGIPSQVPGIGGYVVTAEREGLSLVTMKGKEGDPILAQWQHGLGKVVCFTSDASTRWARQWVSWPMFTTFWEQHIRWAMRPGGSANIRVVTDSQGDNTLVTVEALDAAGERLNFANFTGRLVQPGSEGIDVTLQQTGPGRYQAIVPTDKAGSYVLSLRYAAPDPSTADGILEGSVQAAIVRPFADEYRTLEDNSALLVQVAEMTGGRVLPLTTPLEQRTLWDRTNLDFPVATRSVWMWFAAIGIGMFLIDVGVRRVRIDPAAIARGTMALFRRGEATKTQSIDALKGAREQARERLAARGASPADLKAAAKQAERQAAAVAKTKFEASDDELKAAKGGIKVVGAESGGPPIIEKKTEEKKPEQKPGEGLGRLMQAKKKARDGMGED